MEITMRPEPKTDREILEELRREEMMEEARFERYLDEHPQYAEWLHEQDGYRDDCEDEEEEEE